MFFRVSGDKTGVHFCRTRSSGAGRTARACAQRYLGRARHLQRRRRKLAAAFPDRTIRHGAGQDVKARRLLSDRLRQSRPSHRAPTIGQRRNRHARIGQKARKSDNPTASATRQPPQADADLPWNVPATIPARSRPPFLPGARLRNRPALSLPKSSPAALPSRYDNRIMQHSTRQAHREIQT